MLEMPEPWDTCRGKLLTGNGTNPREKSVLLSRKLNEAGDLKRALTPDLEIVWSLPDWFWIYFGPVFSSGMVVDIPCHCM